MLCIHVDVLNENTSDNGTFRGILLQSIARLFYTNICAIDKTVASTINALNRERVCGIKRNTLACRNLNLEGKTMRSLYTHHRDLEAFLLTLQFSVSTPVFHPAGFVTLAYASC